MYCAHCGKVISEGQKFCPSCGNSVSGKTVADGKKVCKGCGVAVHSSYTVCPHCKRYVDTGAASVYTPTQTFTYKPATNGAATAGLILAFFIPILGIIFSCVGIKNANETGVGMARSCWGLIIGIVGQIINVIIVLALRKAGYYY